MGEKIDIVVFSNRGCRFLWSGNLNMEVLLLLYCDLYAVESDFAPFPVVIWLVGWFTPQSLKIQATCTSASAGC